MDGLARQDKDPLVGYDPKSRTMFSCQGRRHYGADNQTTSLYGSEAPSGSGKRMYSSSQHTDNSKIFVPETPGRRTRKQESGDFGEEIGRLKEMKRQQRIENTLEKKQTLNELKKYNPWGKPGGGAPNDDMFGPDGLLRSVPSESEYPGFVGSFGQNYKPPLPPSSKGSRSGSVNQDSYSTASRDQRADQGKLYSMNSFDSQGDKIDYQAAYDMRARDPSEGYQDRYPMDTRSFNNNHYDQQYEREPKPDYHSRDPHYGGREVSMNGQRHELPPRNGQGSKEEEAGIYFPFGTAGGGAPNRDPSGKVVTVVRNRLGSEVDPEEERKRSEAAKHYGGELQKEMMEQQLSKMKEKQMYRSPSMDSLVDRMQHSQVARQDRDSQSGGYQAGGDLKGRTPYAVQDDPDASSNSAGYRSALSQEAEERHLLRQLEKLKDQQEEIHHQKASLEMFGRPGGGAPNRTHAVPEPRPEGNREDLGNIYYQSSSAGYGDHYRRRSQSGEDRERNGREQNGHNQMPPSQYYGSLGDIRGQQTSSGRGGNFPVLPPAEFGRRGSSGAPSESGSMPRRRGNLEAALFTPQEHSHWTPNPNPPGGAYDKPPPGPNRMGRYRRGSNSNYETVFDQRGNIKRGEYQINAPFALHD